MGTPQLTDSAQYFRFNTRIISATGAPADREHPNVLRLRTNATLLETLVQRATDALLPAALGARLRQAFPEWYLPRRFVLKREIDDHPRCFDQERSVYLHRLSSPSLQGTVVPRLLAEALGALAAVGVSHDDVKLDNFHFVGGGGGGDGGEEEGRGRARIMVVDFEQVDLDLGEEDSAWVVQSNVDRLVRRWREHLRCLRADGLMPTRREAAT